MKPDSRNLGPASWRMLATAGIPNMARLRQLGAVAAWQAVNASGARPSLNLPWAMQGAIDNLPWQQVAREQRLSLLLQVEPKDTPDE